MAKYLITRVLSGLLTLFLILTIVFFLMRVAGGSPVYHMMEADEITPEAVAEMEKKLGLDKPLVVQYVRYLWDCLHGDFGKSYFNGKDVFENMVNAWEPTIFMALLATVFMTVIGIPLGVIGAVHRNTALDYGITTVTLFMQTLPGFWLSILLMYVICYLLNLFPLVGYKYIADVGFLESMRYMVVPALSISISSIGSIARQTRNSFLGVMKEDYIRTAKAKGLSKFKILYKHGLKNAISLITAMITNNIAGLLGGSIVVEKIFKISGIGMICLDSLNKRDYAQQQACILACAAIFVVANILQDVIYKLIDPRINYND